MAFSALEAEYKDGGTIIDQLLEDGIITEDGYELYKSYKEKSEGETSL